MPKTGTLPGFEGTIHTDIIDKADEYEKVRNKRMKALEQEIELNGELVEL